jgi:hypothetical protein
MGKSMRKESEIAPKPLITVSTGAARYDRAAQIPS